jgi:AbrB family looped-hinge helix DNA binding protein
MSADRLRVSAKGAIKLPEELRETLEWPTGSYLEYEVKDGKLEIWKIEIDLFAEAIKKPDEDKFDKIMGEQAESQEKAFDEFDERIKNPGEIRPEDRPEFWD